MAVTIVAVYRAGDPGYLMGFAFANGYFLGLLRAAHEEAVRTVGR